jgi:serine protease Do
VVDADGLVLTKASEVVAGELTARLSDGQRVPAEILSVDEESDVALVRVASKRLRPIQWALLEPSVGQWAITPGIDSPPEAVGIVSSPPRKILPKQALIGVQLDFEAADARIAEVMPGMGAEKAGLRAGDVILAVNGEAVSSSEVLRRTLKQYREGQTVKLQVRRDSDPFDVSLAMMAPRPERLGRGFERQDRMNRLGGEISRRAEGFELAIQHDTVLQPWQCGGPLLDLDGKAIGLNIARAGRIASYALPAKMVMRLAESLKRQSQTPVKERPSS